MMKKLLIFMLVLGLATVANAALQLSLNHVTNGEGITQEITVPVSTELIIDVHGPAAYSTVGYVVINGGPPQDGEWGDTLGPPYTVASGYYNKSGYPVVHSGVGGSPAGNMGSTIRYGDATCFGYEFTIADNQNKAFILGGEQFEYMFHCRTAPSDAVIYLYDAAVGEGAVVLDTIIVHQIPEPATIALLGLGGLLLRRRK
jgi:hypothetical protein